MKATLMSVLAVLVLLGAVVAGVVLVSQEQDIRNKAASGSDCQHAPDCDLLDNVGDIGTYSAPGTIRYVDITDQDYHRYNPGDTDECRRVNIVGNTVSWERLQDTSECKDISNIQVWYDTNNQPSPSPSPTASPTNSPIASSTPRLGCPLEPQVGDILVNFNTKKLVANGDLSQSKSSPVSATLPAGTYKVILASSDNHPESSSQPNEQYLIDILNSGQVLASSNAISDLADQETYKTQTVNDNLVVGSSANQVTARHISYPSSNENSINAECAILRRIIIATNAQCYEVKVFDENWARILAEDYQELKEGDVIRFTVSGSSDEGTFDKARFLVNGSVTQEVTQKRPGTNEFYTEYIIPANMTQLSVKGELHHTTLGWF